jgi:hypothetical protein
MQKAMAPSAVKATMYDGVVQCKTCHYSLENLAEHRCPECGRAFDPNDESTFDCGVRKPISQGLYLLILMLILLLIMLVAAFVVPGSRNRAY